MVSRLTLRDKLINSHQDCAASITKDVARWVKILHPGYPIKPTPMLIDLAAPDVPEGGLDLPTAKVICGILAMNRWDGWFSKDQAGNNKVDEADGILPAGSYFFHLFKDGKEQRKYCPWKYPITPSFRDWNFPHSNLPTNWVSGFSNLEECTDTVHHDPWLISGTPRMRLLARDVTCRVSGYFEANEVAHLIPSSESSWAERNSMQDYALKKKHMLNIIDDPGNLIWLSSEIHSRFDNSYWTIAPKAFRDGNCHLVVHFFSESEILRLYHNVPLHQMKGISIECLFARFAWTVFQSQGPFIGLGMEKVLSIVEPSKIEPTVRSISGKYPIKSSASGKSSNPSLSKKQKRTTDAEEQEATMVEDGSNNEEGLSDNLSSDDYEGSSRLSHLAAQYLEVERARSDPKGTWADELKWADLYTKKGKRASSQAEVLRWYQTLGYEIGDDDDDVMNVQ